MVKSEHEGDNKAEPLAEVGEERKDDSVGEARGSTAFASDKEQVAEGEEAVKRKKRRKRKTSQEPKKKEKGKRRRREASPGGSREASPIPPPPRRARPSTSFARRQARGSSTQDAWQQSTSQAERQQRGPASASWVLLRTSV